MVDDDTLAEVEPGVASGGGVVIRGPWRNRVRDVSDPVPDAQPVPIAPTAEVARARRERRERGAGVLRYEAIVLRVGSEEARRDPVAATDAILELLSWLEPDELADVLRQRLAGHRTR